MYLTQHHIEPLGVSGFTWEYYWKKRTGEVPLQSYVINPDKCREVWEYYAKLWAEYPNVIWQLGLRGKGDTPVWELDPNVPFDSRGRGRLISNAIADEYCIIEKVLGRSDFVSTVTLWLECGRLMAEKQLELPENSIIVYSDEGANQMFYQDLEQSGAYTKKGIYYHAAFIAAGPHLVRGNNPVRMTEQVCHALGMGCEEYAILNVSNIREFIENIDCFSGLMRYGTRFCRKDAVIHYSEKLFSSKSVADRINMFYAGYPQLSNGCMLLDGITVIITRQLIGYFLNPSRKPGLSYINYINNDRYSDPIKMSEYLESVFVRGYDAMAAFIAECGDIPMKSQEFYKSQFIYQPSILMSLYGWAISICRAIGRGDCSQIAMAKQYIDDIRGYMEKNSYSNSEHYLADWTHWYRGCGKISIDLLEAETDKLDRIMS